MRMFYTNDMYLKIFINKIEMLSGTCYFSRAIKSNNIIRITCSVLKCRNTFDRNKDLPMADTFLSPGSWLRFACLLADVTERILCSLSPSCSSEKSCTKRMLPNVPFVKRTDDNEYMYRLVKLLR